MNGWDGGYHRNQNVLYKRLSVRFPKLRCHGCGRCFWPTRVFQPIRYQGFERLVPLRPSPRRGYRRSSGSQLK